MTPKTQREQIQHGEKTSVFVIPERLYHLFSSPRQSLSRGPYYLWIRISGFPIKALGNNRREATPYVRHP